MHMSALLFMFVGYRMQLFSTIGFSCRMDFHIVFLFFLFVALHFCLSEELLTPKCGSSKKLSKKLSADEDMDIESMTDAELAAKLREMGVDVGPIIGKFIS